MSSFYDTPFKSASEQPFSLCGCKTVVQTCDKPHQAPSPAAVGSAILPAEARPFGTWDQSLAMLDAMQKSVRPRNYFPPSLNNTSDAVNARLCNLPRLDNVVDGAMLLNYNKF